mgnify:CR=1 FL=1
MKKFIVILLSLTLLAGLNAQDMKNIENYRIYKMSEYLDLTPKQAEKFFPLMREYEHNLKDIKFEEERLYSELKRMQKSNKVDERELEKAMDRVDDLERERTTVKRNFRKRSSNILNPNQVAKMSTFENDFRNHLKQTYIQKQKQNWQSNRKLKKKPR